MAPELNWTLITETFIKSFLDTCPRNAKVAAVTATMRANSQAHLAENPSGSNSRGVLYSSLILLESRTIAGLVDLTLQIRLTRPVTTNAAARF